ncbi:Vitamin K epoxide reductase complex subunit 1 [Trichoplax sp. H2]|nr:Vitamin K epoxide reductase complex subunit 1 [Trichoplax sp. H2]|eukprot:RDD41557.1 Vitamin K epoxide reductase complex subunit 1 [Trichoplax sp. H2]
MAISPQRGGRISAGVAVMSLVGLALSVYALHVETTKESNKNYKAFCDFGASISCSKVFTSKYGKGFGLIAPIFGQHSSLNQPNSIYGIIFYCIQICLGKE